ncbi:MAG: bifunctional dTDP-4-dehydrorhamnose 3,5-epimerase family protein/NAD(P)-dependent oxidoreductase [Actinomycetota bacterium]|nr:bifunctional dTDP-4-dehydrorhamnose 3,5-epimerase family protein/NAD(P)-dependent oxidoreductase [Actinomycetota bacterium]
MRLPVHGDARGWFKENWQRAKMTALGLPDFAPVQHSVAHNGAAGTTRGIHGEPWDKLVSVAAGRAFGAWVDLREGPSFGTVHTQELDEATAVFVPRGVGNSYQTLVPDTVYSYLVNAHWSPDAHYTHLNLADPTAAVPWPIPLAQAVVSDKDREHTELTALTPVTGPGTLVLGGTGQLGQALARRFPGARVVGRDELDLADLASIGAFDLAGVGTVLNAAAYTAVDAAEGQGRAAAWATNATGVAALARACAAHRLTLVHYSTDYVYDGTGGSGEAGAWREDDPVCPLGVYGQSKAAGDLAVSLTPRHYLLRTSWVVGEGANFVATMRRLAQQGVHPKVVDDQVGRLTFTDDLAAATAHLLAGEAAYGTYNATNSGRPGSWADIARQVFEHEGRDPGDVTPVNTAAYSADAPGPLAPRPAQSTLDLAKLVATGHQPRDQWAALTAHLERA